MNIELVQKVQIEKQYTFVLVSEILLLVFVMTAGLGITIMESKFFWLCLALASKAQSLASQRLVLEETR